MRISIATRLLLLLLLAYQVCPLLLGVLPSPSHRYYQRLHSQSSESGYERRNSRDADKIAVLVDGDNAESSLVAEFIAEAGRFGKVTVKRIYADWTSPQMKSWKDELNSHAVRPIQKFAYTKSKGSTDTALIIDAMDLLHSKLVDGFCIVSSDSDYTGLAHRIREEGMFIMGIGKRHTPEAFVKACESFTYSEILAVADSGRRAPKVRKVRTEEDGAAIAVQAVEVVSSEFPEIDLDLVDRAFRIAVNIDNGRAQLSRLADELRKLDSTFDHRNFGFSSFRKFCETPPMRNGYETSLDKDNTTYLIAEKVEKVLIAEKVTPVSATAVVVEKSTTPKTPKPRKPARAKPTKPPKEVADGSAGSTSKSARRSKAVDQPASTRARTAAPLEVVAVDSSVPNLAEELPL